MQSAAWRHGDERVLSPATLRLTMCLGIPLQVQSVPSWGIALCGR